MSMQWNDTLIALVEQGPLWDGDVPSKRQRDELIEHGLCAKVVVRGEDGYNAATYAGREAYVAMLESDDFAQAKAKRIAHSFMVRSMGAS